MGKVINVDGTKFSFGSCEQGAGLEQCLYQHVPEGFLHLRKSPML